MSEPEMLPQYLLRLYSITDMNYRSLNISFIREISSMDPVSADLVKADPESVAVEVRVLPGLSRLPGVLDGRLPRRGPAGRRRGGVLLVAEMFVLQNVVSVLTLKISRNRRHDGSVDRETDTDVT